MATPKEIRKQLAQHDQYLDAELNDTTKEELKERALRFAIDVNNLTEEISRQPADYAYYAYTLAVHETIRAKAALKTKLVESGIITAIKARDPRDGRSGGPTVGQIEASVQNDLTYQKALVDLRNAEHRVALLNADVTASAQKAAMLKLFSELMKKESQMKGFVVDESAEKNRKSK
jgi:hypothetical protein